MLGVMPSDAKQWRNMVYLMQNLKPPPPPPPGGAFLSCPFLYRTTFITWDDPDRFETKDLQVYVSS